MSGMAGAGDFSIRDFSIGCQFTNAAGSSAFSVLTSSNRASTISGLKVNHRKCNRTVLCLGHVGKNPAQPQVTRK